MGDCDPSGFRGIVSLLRFFAETGRYNVLDRIGFAQNPEAVEESIYEAIRTVRALERRAEMLKLKLDGDVREFECLEYEKIGPGAPCNGVRGRLAERKGNLEEGSEVCCHTRPLIPGEDELGRFYRILHGLEECEIDGLDLAKQLAALAFSYPRSQRG